MLSRRRTPAMGWNSWNAFRCYDANETAILAQADQLINLGLAEAGYDTVVVDDCWQAPTRGGDGELRACPERFPSGMAALGQEIRSRGLRFGLYLAPGRRTCAQIWDAYGIRRCGCPLDRLRATLARLDPRASRSEDLGSWAREQEDLEQVLSWGVEYLKYDWCQGSINTGSPWRLWRDALDPVEAFTHMSALIDAAEQEVHFSISEYGKYQPWRWAPRIANSWRTTGDIQPSAASIFRIARATERVAWSTRPGRICDPDMLQIGNLPGSRAFPDDRDPRATLDYAHMAMWAMLAAPLMIGTDLRGLTPDSLPVRVLTDSRLLALNQDPLVVAGRIVADGPDGTVWRRRTAAGTVTLTVERGCSYPTGARA